MSWDDLSMREKAAMMRVAVKNKIFDIGLIKELYNKFSEGGYIYSTPEEKALLKANSLVEPASNYSEATDMSISPLREWITDIVLRTIPECPTGLSNCTLTASLFYGKPIGRAATIVSNPEANNFYLVSEDYAVPGTMVIASSPEGTPNPVYHTMILSGYADKDYPFEYNGIHYDIKKGDPLVHYSKGKNSADNYKKNIPLKVYTDLSHGKTLNRYYRPFDENSLPNVLLPELVVLPTDNLVLLNNVNMYEDGGHKYISYYDLANDPQYGYHLIEDGKNGQPTYYNANTGQWFLASKALNEGRLSEIKAGDTFTPIITNPVPELPAVSNYISSLISNMLKPLTEELAWDKLLEKAKETFSWFPGIGDGIELYDIGKDIYNENYGMAALGLGMLVLPEIFEKGIKLGIKGVKKIRTADSDLAFELFKKRASEREDDIYQYWKELAKDFTLEERRVYNKAYGAFSRSNTPELKEYLSDMSREEIKLLDQMVEEGKAQVILSTPTSAFERIPTEVRPEYEDWYGGALARVHKGPRGLYFSEWPAGYMESDPITKTHEWNHMLYFPTEKIPEDTYDKSHLFYKYLFENANGTESSARGSQLKSYFDTHEITPEMWEYAKENYVKDTGKDNNMTEWFESVKDVPKFLLWLNKHAIQYIAPIAGTGYVANKLIQENDVNQ